MSKTTKSEENATTPASTEENTSGSEQPVCGVVMPISTIDGCPAEHWLEVKSIIYDAIISAGYKPNLVSEADDSGIIQKRIIQNLYNNDIVIVDVSAKNPNVMFELGIRLAFDKPTIIVKDDFTDYSFDTSVIEHISYPRTLRFNNIVQFKKKLKEKIEGTMKVVVNSESDYTTFLKHFGEFKVAKLEKTEISSNEFIINSIKKINSEISQIRQSVNNNINNNISTLPKGIGINRFFYLKGKITEYIITSKYTITHFIESENRIESLIEHLMKNYPVARESLEKINTVDQIILIRNILSSIKEEDTLLFNSL